MSIPPSEIFKIVHLLGLMLVFAGFGARLGGDSCKKISGMLHGIGLVIILLFGFAMHGSMAKSGAIEGMPLFVILKLVIWLILGGLPAFVSKGKLSAISALWVALAFGTLSAVLGVLWRYLPFLQ